MNDPTLQQILKLAHDQFENLVFECVKSRGMKNVIWRTPGADGGRDIEGEVSEIDLSGSTDGRKWYIECKRYQSSIDWPTVRGKLAYAESNDADFLLMATTSNPSPQCESEISKWNSQKRRPQIRFWRGYDLPNIVRGVPHIATMFGLVGNVVEANNSLIPLAEVATRIAQTSYTRNYFNQSDTTSIETVAAVSELFSVRLKDIRDFSKPVSGPKVGKGKMFDWLDVQCDLPDWEDTPLRAIVSFLRYEFQSGEAVLTAINNRLELKLTQTPKDSYLGLPNDRSIISFWARIDTYFNDKSNTWVLERLPYV